jgi:branched-chain amino acid transport system permease protein
MQQIFNILTLSGTYILFSLGLSLVWGTVGVLNFAHGVTFMFAAYVASVISSHIDLGLIELLALGALTGAVLSLLTEFVAFGPIQRRGRDRNTADLQILIAGIGIAAIPLAITQYYVTSGQFSIETRFHPSTVELAGAHITTAELLTIVLSVVLGTGLTVWLKRSNVGLALRALGLDAQTATIMGVNSRRLAALAMGLAGALAGLAGVLLTLQLGAIEPDTGNTFLIKAFAIVVLGGVGSLGGTILGCFVLAACENFVLTQTSGQWVDAISYAIIFVILLLRPQGLFGRRPVRKA